MALLVLILLFTGRARYYAIKDAFSSGCHWIDKTGGSHEKHELCK